MRLTSAAAAHRFYWRGVSAALCFHNYLCLARLRLHYLVDLHIADDILDVDKVGGEVHDSPALDAVEAAAAAAHRFYWRAGASVPPSAFTTTTASPGSAFTTLWISTSQMKVTQNPLISGFNDAFADSCAQRRPNEGPSPGSWRPR